MKNTLILLALLTVSNPAQAQWTHLEGPEWGTGMKLAQNGAVIYAISAGKLYRSTDEGYHWVKLDCPVEKSVNVRKMMATNTAIYILNFDYQLFRGSENGQTWTVVMDQSRLKSLTGRTWYDFFARDSLVLLGDDRYILASDDRGDHWNVSEDLTSQKLSRFVAFNGEFIAWGGTYVYRSSDRGRTWVKVYSTLGNILTVNAVQNAVYLLYKNTDRIVKSTDGFRSWETIFPDSTLGFWEVSNSILPVFFSNSPGSVYLMVQQSNHCWLAMYVSHNGGRNWEELIDTPGDRFSFSDMAIFDDHLILGLKNGMVITGYDFSNLRLKSSGMHDVSPVSIWEQGGQKIISSPYNSFTSTDEGHSWTLLFPEYIPGCLNTKKITGVTSKRAVLREDYEYYITEDGGATWTSILSNFPVGSVVCTSDRIWYDDTFYLYMLADGSTGPVHIDIPAGESNFSRTLTGYEDGMILTTQSGTFYFYDKTGTIYRTVPAGNCNDWDPIVYDGHTLLQFCQGHIYAFEATAAEWREIFPQIWQNPDSLHTYGVKFVKAIDGVIWLGTRTGGLFFSPDHGQHFYPYALPSPGLNPVSIQKLGEQFWIGVENNGIYVTDAPRIKQDGASGIEFKIQPNPSVDGKLSIVSKQYLTSELFLELFDITGRKLSAQTAPSGQQWTIQFPGIRVGVYYVKLSTEGSTQTLEWVVYR